MLNKTLRILIADADDNRRLNVEKVFNKLGCYGIAPVSTIDELTTLLDFPPKPFDLVLINCTLMGQESAGTLDTIQNADSNVVLYSNYFFSDAIAETPAGIAEGLAAFPFLAATQTP